MSHDFGLTTALLNSPCDNHRPAHSEFEINTPADTGSTSWDDAWIDIGGEG